MPKKPPLSDDEKQTFQNAMRGVKKLDKNATHQPSRKLKKPDHQARQRASEFKQSSHYAHIDDIPTQQRVSGDEALEYQRSNLPRNAWQPMKRGTLEIEARLDLHQLRSDEALQELDHFIHHCQQRGLRYALVIHGKGFGSHDNTPVLKNLVYRHCRSHPQVLACLSARPKHGGTGALYVLIKNRTR